MDHLPMIAALSERFGDGLTAALIGLVTGVLFGAAAQRSAFCLRAATVEFARRQMGPRMAVWLLSFSSAAVWVQTAALSGLFAPNEARMLAVTGSISGAVLGGLISSTFLSLLYIPAIFTIVDDFAHWTRRRLGKRFESQRQLAHAPAE